MLPRRQSIFHLGDDGGAQYHRRSLVGAAAMVTGDSRRVRERLVVGLQILVQHHHQHYGGGSIHHDRHAHAANIVFKQMVRPRRAAAHHAVPCSFLKSCSLCRRELTLNKDVFMYRGDQGFCSEECRGQQIRVDEAREREAMSKQRRGLSHSHHHNHAAIGGRQRKTLAVA